LNDQFNEFDQTIRTLSDWVQEQTSDLEFMRSRNLEAGAKDNIRKCNVNNILSFSFFELFLLV
jgi:hypothetical protein